MFSILLPHASAISKVCMYTFYIHNAHWNEWVLEIGNMKNVWSRNLQSYPPKSTVSFTSPRPHTLALASASISNSDPVTGEYLTNLDLSKVLWHAAPEPTIHFKSPKWVICVYYFTYQTCILSIKENSCVAATGCSANFTRKCINLRIFKILLTIVCWWRCTSSINVTTATTTGCGSVTITVWTFIFELRLWDCAGL